MVEHLTGPALDAEICRLVFGLRVEAEPLVSGDLAYGVWGQNPKRPAYVNAPLPYSSDIAAAWRVVEHYRAQGWLVRVQEHPDGFPFYLALDEHNMPDERSRVEKRALCLINLFGPASHGKPRRACEGRGYGASAPEAICRAALDLVEGQS